MCGQQGCLPVSPGQGDKGNEKGRVYMDCVPNRGTRRVKRRRPATRVILKASVVWELLDLLDISQNELARLAGISPSHLSYLMNGVRSPSPRVRRRLQQALGVDDFHRLFSIVPVDDGGEGERTAGP